MFCSIQTVTARPPAVNQCNYTLRIQPVQYNLLANHTGTEMVPIAGTVRVWRSHKTTRSCQK